jgi:MoaA/NifB/PqqE/SkfB family radical SAM enzyme
LAVLIDPGRKVLRHPEVLAQMQRGERVWPVNVELDLTNCCNLACRWCNSKDIHNGQEMDTDLALGTLRELADGGTKAITFTGGGEPSLHPEFAGIVGTAKGMGLSCGVYTNGVEIAPLLAALPYLSWVYVSLDAVNPVNYEMTKGGPFFGIVRANIRRLVAENSNAAIGVGFLLDTVSYSMIPTAIREARAMGATYCQFRPVVMEGQGYSWVHYALDILSNLKAPDVYYSQERFIELMEGRNRNYTVCRAAELVPCIGAGGEVWVCPNTRGKRLIGNLSEGGFATVWEKRSEQLVGDDCRAACRNHALNETLEYICGEGGPHDGFV